MSSKKACPYCGNNPVNHRLIKLAESIDLVLAPAYRVMSRLHHSPIDKAVTTLIKLGVMPLRMMGLWSFHADPHRARSDRSRVIWHEAQRRGIEMQGISVFGRPIEQYRAKINGRWHYFESLPIPPRYNYRAYSWIDDKAKLRSLFTEHKIPIAQGGATSTLEHAYTIFDSGTAPFIVKPRVGSRGRHTTTHIYTKQKLEHAFAIAKQLCHYVVVEEQLIGSVYRGTYVNGEVVGVLRGDPPRVTGDGKRTISELIRVKNQKKHKKVADVIVNAQVRDFLQRQGLTLKTILQKGTTVDLSEKIGIAYGGFAAEEFPKTHQKLVHYLKRAGDILGCPVVGFDFIIEDVSKDPDQQRWGIIEANSLPFIDLHHFPLAGKPINVAAKIWDLWDHH